MRKQVIGAAMAAAVLGVAPAGHAAPTAVKVTDVEGDANFTAQAAANRATPVGNQEYADVLSVTWAPVVTTKVVNRKKVSTVTGFTVTTVTKAAPTPPAGTALVFRMLGVPPCGSDAFFGVVYYTTKGSDPSIPQSAIRDNCTGTTRLTPIALPTIQGNSIKWTVPLSAVPKDLRFKAGTKLAGLWFEVRELEDFKGQKTPDQLPLGYGGQYGLAAGIVDNGESDAVYQVM